MQSETNIYGGEGGGRVNNLILKKKRFKGWGFLKELKARIN